MVSFSQVCLTERPKADLIAVSASTGIPMSGEDDPALWDPPLTTLSLLRAHHAIRPTMDVSSRARAAANASS